MKNEVKLSLEECLKAAVETEGLCIGDNAIRDIPVLLTRYFEERRVCIIADENTWEAAGLAIRDALEAGGITMAAPLIFPGSPRLHAEYPHVRIIVDHLSSLSNPKRLVPIAAGAGTINDLVKRAASELSLPYLCAPTAVSVDGYTSYGAALLSDGFKQTFPCAAPRLVAADTGVLRRAPAYLSSSGFGDLAGKIIAGTDWIIAEKAGALGAPGTEPIDPLAWSMTQTGLIDTLRRSAGAVRGDSDAAKILFEALSITGFAMQRLRSSRPVSGCEHLWSHIWEMRDLSVDGLPVTHGHKVAMGTLAAAAFTELLFADPHPPRPAPAWRRPSSTERETEVLEAFSDPAFGSGAVRGSPLQASVLKTAREKLLDNAAAAALAEKLRDNWKELRDAVREKFLPYKELRDLLGQGGCPLLPAEINLSRTAVIATARPAQMIRNRYTVLDLAWDLGVFESILTKMEASETYLR